MKIALGKSRADEKGQALILVLILLLWGGLMIAPFLAYMGTGLKANQVYEEAAFELYAADAGIEDAMWQIKYPQPDSLLTSPAYDAYDYTTVWTYDLPEKINDKNARATIENTWIPKNVSPPSKTQARAIIETGKLIVSGNTPEASSYQIKIAYYPGEEEDLVVQTLGIWLPPGFSYVEGTSNLEADPDKDYYSEPVIEAHAGSQTVIWSFSSVPFAVFPGVDEQHTPMTADITFEFDARQPGYSPEAVSWITTSGVDDIPFSWDADTKVYRITSVAGGIEIEAYCAQSELRKLGWATSGDYRAIGNTLMIDQFPDYGGPKRDTLLDESDAEVNDIPSDAEVVAAHLYWSAWVEEPIGEEIADTSAIFKINGQQVYFNELGEPEVGDEEIIASAWSSLENEPDEYSYSCYLDVTELVQAFSSVGHDDNHTGNGIYTIGGVYGDTDDEWSYAAWSLVIIYSSTWTRGRQLYLYDDFIYSDEYQNVDFDNDGQPGGTISGFITPEPIAGETEAAKLTCFVGEGDNYYEGDSVKVNDVYLSNAENPWDNVWNSKSAGLVSDGIDIDTFSISWSSGIIQPSDTSAQVDLPTGVDSWNLVYIILSFRSETTTGGAISYLIRG